MSNVKLAKKLAIICGVISIFSASAATTMAMKEKNITVRNSSKEKENTNKINRFGKYEGKDTEFETLNSKTKKHDNKEDKKDTEYKISTNNTKKHKRRKYKKGGKKNTSMKTVKN